MRSKKYGVIALALFACFALLFCTGGESAAFPGEPAGFSGLTWGTPIDVLESLKYVGTDSAGMSLYERAGDELFFGRARLAAIEYGFENGRLAAVSLKVDSLLQYLLMKEEAFRRYGRGEELPGGEDSYVWNGDNTKISLISNFVVS
ncbi:MAG: hypothetical protein H6Q52_223 [Deltaproteobacteria bacterium]|nr:hypothetical protein [Deltaproteobacteria bacterium]